MAATSNALQLQLEPYLSFNGRCEEALEFYKGVFGGEVTQLMRYDGMPGDAGIPDDYKNKVMHSNFRSPTLAFMASDGWPGSVTDAPSSRISLSLGTRDLEAAQRVFDALSTGGEVAVPFRDAFWGARFGMVNDKFGIAWMVNAEKS